MLALDKVMALSATGRAFKAKLAGTHTILHSCAGCHPSLVAGLHWAEGLAQHEIGLSCPIRMCEDQKCVESHYASSAHLTLLFVVHAPWTYQQAVIAINESPLKKQAMTGGTVTVGYNQLAPPSFSMITCVQCSHAIAYESSKANKL